MRAVCGMLQRNASPAAHCRPAGVARIPARLAGADATASSADAAARAGPRRYISSAMFSSCLTASGGSSTPLAASALWKRQMGVRHSRGTCESSLKL